MRFTYDSRNNLTALCGGERLWQENQYNGLGCRTGMKAGEEMLACCVDYADEYRRILTEQGTQSRNYLWQDSTLLGMPGEEGYVLTDAFHTPVQVLDREGKLLNLYQYDEFGRLTKKREAYELPFGYTGYRKEAAPNLYFAGAREYNGESGSFLTKDLWRYLKAEEPSTANLYLYGKGNPLKYMDFGGHEAVVEKSYLERSLDCALLSGFTGEVTLLGLGIRIGAGAAGVDLPLDVLDLLSDLTVNYNPKAPSWWLTTLVDLVSVLPVVGVIKYLDEAGVLAKTGTKSLKALYKSSDEIVDEAKEINRLMEAMDAAGGIGMRSGGMILKEAQDLTGNSAWRTGGEAIMEGARRLDGISGMADGAKPLWNGIETAGDGASGWNKVQKAVGAEDAVIGGFKGTEGAVSTAKDVQKSLNAVDAAAETAKDVKKGEEAVEGVIEGGLKTNYNVLNISSADDVNAIFKDTMGYEPPYKPGTMVTEIELTENTTFVRVYDKVNSRMQGGWVMKAEDIVGLTPQEIQNKFALPNTPQYICDVNLEVGTRLRTGEVNPLFGFDGGGQQYDLIINGKNVGTFTNERMIGQ